MAVLVYADRDRLRAEAVIDATGVALVTFRRPPPGFFYLIERIAVSSTSALNTVASVYVGTVDPMNLIDFTQTGNGDIADEDSPILIGEQEDVLIQWTGGTPGAFVRARLQVVKGKLTPNQF